MADFCLQCAEFLFGSNIGDLAGLCGPNETISVLCEGCGQVIVVDSKGKRIDDWKKPVI